MCLNYYFSLLQFTENIRCLGLFFPNYIFARRVSHQRASLGLRNAIATATALTSFQVFLFFLSLGAKQKVGMGREQERSWKRSCS